MTDKHENEQHDEEQEEQSFPLTYVQELRQEAAEHRTRAARADTYRDALRAAVLDAASAGALREPLPWSDDYDNPETGLPDAERIAAAVEELAAAKPWLAKPSGDVGQGFRGEESDTVNLAEVLRAGA